MQISVTKRSPALTKNEMRPTTSLNFSCVTSPDFFTVSSTAIAVASAKASSCTGVAPASCRWYEQMFIGFHFGSSPVVKIAMSLISRIEGAGGNT